MLALKSLFRQFLFLVLSSFIYLAATAQTLTSNEIIKKSFEAVSSINNGSYKINFAQKYLDRKDTIFLKGQCIFRKDQNIKIGAKLNIVQDASGNQHIYNGKELLFLNKNDSTALIINTKKYGLSYIEGNIANELIFNPIIKESIKNILNNNDIDTILQSEEIIDNNTPCYVLHIKYNDKAETKNITSDYYINKTTFIPIRKISNLDWQGQHQYQDYKIFDLKINSLLTQDDNLFTRQAIPIYYKNKIYTPEPEIKPLAQGKYAPECELVNTSGQKINIKGLKGNIVILDFSYKSCYYCKKLLPDLQKVKDQYENSNIEFFIVNPFDTSLTEYTAYLQEHNINIPALKGTKEMIKIYNVPAYPTLYIIDEKGKIAASFVGYNQTSQTDVEKTIEKLLKASNKAELSRLKQ